MGAPPGEKAAASAAALGLRYDAAGRLTGSGGGGGPTWRESTVALWHSLAITHAPRDAFTVAEYTDAAEARWADLCWSHARHGQWKNMPRRVLQHHVLTGKRLSLFDPRPGGGFALRGGFDARGVLNVGGGGGKRGRPMRAGEVAVSALPVLPPAPPPVAGKAPTSDAGARYRAMGVRPAVASPGVRVLALSARPLLQRVDDIAKRVKDEEDDDADMSEVAPGAHLPPSKRLRRGIASMPRVVYLNYDAVPLYGASLGVARHRSYMGMLHAFAGCGAAASLTNERGGSLGELSAALDEAVCGYVHERYADQGSEEAACVDCETLVAALGHRNPVFDGRMPMAVASIQEWRRALAEGIKAGR